MKKETRQFVIYSRKSKFTGKGESIENQIELCRQYIAVHFSQEEADAALVYEDEGFSGGNLERPQFKKMMKDSPIIGCASPFVAFMSILLRGFCQRMNSCRERSQVRCRHAA